MNQELLRIVDGLARDKNIDREVVLEDLEAAILSAARKHIGTDDVQVRIDRKTGDITAAIDGNPMNPRDLGRIAAQTAKQVMIQRIREAERGSILEEYLQKKGQIVTGRTVRWEGGALVVDLARVEAILPRGEQIPGETHGTDERIRALVLDVRDQGNQVKIILSRTHPDFIRALFDLEVPEVAEKIIEIKIMAREAGYRTKVAVNSLDSKVDAVGACVGIRGSRIKNIVDELGGEKIDIVRWNDSSKILIANSLRPAEVSEIALCFELGRATVVVTEDQLSLAIGKRGQNVRLAARLTGWDIDILTPNEFNAGLDVLEKALREVEGVDSTTVDKIVAMGMVNVLDVEEVGPEPLINELALDRAVAQKIVVRCAEAAKVVAEQQAAAAEKAKAERRQLAEAEKAQAEAAAAGETGQVAAGPAEAAEAPDAAEAEKAQVEAAAAGDAGQVAAGPAEAAEAPDAAEAAVAPVAPLVPLVPVVPESPPDQGQAAEPADAEAETADSAGVGAPGPEAAGSEAPRPVQTPAPVGEDGRDVASAAEEPPPPPPGEPAQGPTGPPASNEP